MIPPIAPNVAAAGLKSAGSITATLIGRYRPAGVPRTGSTEDRAGVYQRMWDAATAAHGTIYYFRHVRQQVGERKAETALAPHLGRVLDTGTEVISALGGVRLRGTIEVIASAEELVVAIGDLSMNETDDAVFTAAYKHVIEAQNAFLDAARADLGYNAKPHQVLRRRREKRFLRRRAAAAAIEA